MAFHPTGIVIDIVGTGASNNGRSCSHHNVCGSILEENMVVRIRFVFISKKNGKEEPALAVYNVLDGVDLCRVGFLPRHFLKNYKAYDGVLAQITEVFSIDSSSDSYERNRAIRNYGMCRAAIIQILPQEQVNVMEKDKRKGDALEEKKEKKRMKRLAEAEEEQENE